MAGRSRVISANGGEDTPSPIEHATPDVELANAQLAMGRADAGLEPSEGLEDGAPVQDPAELDEGDYAGGTGALPPGGGPPSGPPGDGGGAVPVPGAAGVPEPRQRPRARLIGFLEGSWRELQRVQWPDRRQVMQATAVVIGFVIVAGVILGVADTLSSHLMNYILTGTKSALGWVAIAVIVLSLAGWMLADRDK